MTREEAVNFFEWMSTLYPEKTAQIAISMAIKALEQPEPCEDCVSRQAAIDAALSAFSRGLLASPDIRRLPSVQPEIVRCKDCKHHWTHRCMDSMPTEICELGQTFYDANVDFCSLAERRTDD